MSHGAIDADRAFDAGDLVDPMDLIGQRQLPGAFFSRVHERNGHPDWLLKNTRFAELGKVPDAITVRDYLTMTANMFQSGPNPGYFIDYAISGVPLYSGALDMALRYAPNIKAAFELLSTYADERPGYHAHRIREESDRMTLEFVPMTDLGPGRPVIVETPILVLMQIAGRCAGEPVREAIIELQHEAPIHQDRLRQVLGCEVRYGCNRDAISLPRELCLRPSVVFDADICNDALIRCREEVVARKKSYSVTQLRQVVGQLMVELGRVPRLAETARRMGVSSRTLIRRLKQEEQSFHDLTDELMKRRCRILLADRQHSISHVSEAVGFADASSFYRSFRRWFGMTPDQYRKRHLSEHKHLFGSAAPITMLQELLWDESGFASGVLNAIAMI